MKIKTVNGTEILISDESFVLVKGFDWNLNNGYVYRDVVNNDGSRTRLYLHRVLTEAPKGLVVDHINGNTLDNRLENLRICTTAENVRNRAKPKGDSINTYKGVRLRGSGYEASIGSGNKHKYLGTYIKNSYEKKAISMKTKIYALALLWLSIGITILIIPYFVVKIIVFLIAFFVSLYILKFKTLVT